MFAEYSAAVSCDDQEALLEYDAALVAFDSGVRLNVASNITLFIDKGC